MVFPATSTHSTLYRAFLVRLDRERGCSFGTAVSSTSASPATFLPLVAPGFPFAALALRAAAPPPLVLRRVVAADLPLFAAAFFAGTPLLPLLADPFLAGVVPLDG